MRKRRSKGRLTALKWSGVRQETPESSRQHLIPTAIGNSGDEGMNPARLLQDQRARLAVLPRSRQALGKNTQNRVDFFALDTRT